MRLKPSVLKSVLSCIIATLRVYLSYSGLCAMYCLQLSCAFMHYLRVFAPIDAFVPSVSQCTGNYNYFEISDMIFSYLSNILMWLWPFRVLFQVSLNSTSVTCSESHEV